MKNPSKMTPKSTRMHTKSGKIDPWAVLGRRLRPGWFWAGFTGVSGKLRATFFAKMEGPRSISGTSENLKMAPNRHFEHKPALGPSKNALWEEFWKKHEI